MASTDLRDPTIDEPAWVRTILIGLAIVLILAIVVLPLAVVVVEALGKGIGAYFTAIVDADTRAALKLTLLVAALTVPANLLFGVVAAWAITKFRFRGKNLLLTLIDLPFSVSPVVAG